MIFNNAPEKFNTKHTKILIPNNVYHMITYDKRKDLDYNASTDWVNFYFAVAISEAEIILQI